MFKKCLLVLLAASLIAIAVPLVAAQDSPANNSQSNNQQSPDKGGWHIFHTWSAGADCANPAPYTGLDASGPTAWFGWPKSDEVQAKIAEWYAAQIAPTSWSIGKIHGRMNEEGPELSSSDIKLAPAVTAPAAALRNGIQNARMELEFPVA